MQWLLFVLFRTNKWEIRGFDKFEKAINNNRPIMLCSWHARFLYAVCFFKKYKTQNIWAVSSTHEDSQIMAYFLKRASIKLIKGSSTRGWENVIKKMFRVFKNSNSIIAISCGSTKYWKMGSWDKLRFPKPFGEIYVEFSDPMKINETTCGVNSADNLTLFLNNHLNVLDNTIK